MLAIQTILFPTDFSECAERAFAHAAYLAEQYSALLHVLNVRAPHIDDPNDPMDELALVPEDAVTLSDAYGLADRSRGIRLIHAQVRAASAVMGILEYADKHDVDLIVMGTHGWRGIDRLIMGSVAEDVVRYASSPVFTVHTSDEPMPPPKRAVARILVPVDFSDFSHRSIAYAKEIARTYGARLDLVHVVEEVLYPAAYGIAPIPFVVPEVIERAHVALDELGRETADGVPYEVHVKRGYPGHQILEFAEELESDLIVIASHGISGFERLLMGSVAEKVVRTAPCPVFTIPSFGNRLVTAAPAALPAVAFESVRSE